MKNGNWYFVHPSQTDGPQKVSVQGVIAGLRAHAALSTDEARRHMADHASGKSPAIGLSNGGFYQWERESAADKHTANFGGNPHA